MQSSSVRPSANHLQALGRARDGEPVSSSQSPSALTSPRSPGAAPENRHFSLTVRQARATDLPGIGRIERIYPLWQPQLSLTEYNASASLIAGRLPGSTDKPIVMVAESNRDIIAFADFKPAMPDRRWVLRALGASTGVYDPSPVWEEVLLSGVRQAGMHGVKRLYAQATAGTSAHVALKAAGFAAYANETIYVADSPRTLGADVSMREQEYSDTWAIHQLYNASVPRDVLYAEALTSHTWDIRNSRRPRANHTAGWLIEDSTGVGAYVRVCSAGGVHAIDVTFPPNAVKRGAALLDAVLRKLRLEKRISRVYIGVRGYQQEIEPALVRLGFAPGLTQELLVRYTAVQVRAVTTEASVLHVELGDRVPSQAPSILTAASRGGPLE
ncbi:MAG: hypothetical protein E6R14_11860 [Thermomicrobiales bacterium]|nr:MAG: hypothetical protein E6R14_11860 [Thermomicrobiales bacterium]